MKVKGLYICLKFCVNFSSPKSKTCVDMSPKEVLVDVEEILKRQILQVMSQTVSSEIRVVQMIDLPDLYSKVLPQIT